MSGDFNATLWFRGKLTSVEGKIHLGLLRVLRLLDLLAVASDAPRLLTQPTTSWKHSDLYENTSRKPQLIAMAEPPSPKRQRLSEPSSTRSQPTTPTRASYQSPTKASLARSHPNLLARSPGRDRNSGTYSRGRNLRLSLLANRTVTLDGDDGPPVHMLLSPKRSANITPQAQVTTGSDGKEGFSAAIARVFTENRPRTSTSTRSPLTSRQPSASNPTRHNRGSPSPTKELTPSFMRPRLVPRPSSSSSSTRYASSEPELPPTPVQLGLEPPAERPRGLISSSCSPRGSKSNSGKRRRRHRGSILATSSPSKLREQIHEDNIPTVEAASIQQDLPEEAPESDVEQLDVQDEAENIPESVKEKQTTRNSLQAELAQLKADMRRLEAMAESEARDITPRTLKALTSTSIRSRSGSPEIVLPELITMPADPIPHLTLLAPARLRVRTITKTFKQNATFLQSHTVNVKAPAPYPPHLFGANIEVMADPQATRIVSVKLVKWHGNLASQHGVLRKWVETRLSSQLHSKDVSGLIWGMGSYWEFCVERAKIWDTLMTGRLSDEEPKPEELVKWLGRPSVEIQVADGVSILLSWTVQLDWTGNVEKSLGIACKGVPEMAHQMVPGIFERLRKRKGIIKAVEGVMKVLQEA